jgi:hypothetical protein
MKHFYLSRQILMLITKDEKEGTRENCDVEQEKKSAEKLGLGHKMFKD